MRQRWHDLLFLHWRVPAGALRPLVPAPLALDTREGSAWLGVIPFRMTGVRRRGWPWGLSFCELNVRTYVVAEGKPGVWFLSLDAASALAVWAARRWFHLPYYRARMACREQDGWIAYRSERVHRHAAPARLEMEYRAAGAPFRAPPGSLAAWLTERYCLYAASRDGRLFRGEVHHAPWPLQPGEARIARNAMHPLVPQSAPLVHFARTLDVLVWPPAPVLGT